MTIHTNIFFISFLLFALVSPAQPAVPERLDSTLSVFWNPNLKVRVQILRPEEEDTKKKNTLLTLYSLDQGSRHILFRDSLYAYTLRFGLADLNGDGIRDLLVYHLNNGPENRSYYLYLADQDHGRLIKVKGFEKVFNPFYDQNQCRIVGYEAFGNQISLFLYQIDKDGKLSRTIWQ